MSKQPAKTNVCANCNWWVLKDYDVDAGYCHGGPPVLVDGFGCGKFPSTKRDWWCGMFAPITNE